MRTRGFYIDPWLPVERAVITHAHADHARAGHTHYLTVAPGAAVLRSRLGEISLEALPYGKKKTRRGVRLKARYMPPYYRPSIAPKPTR